MKQQNAEHTALAETNSGATGIKQAPQAIGRARGHAAASKAFTRTDFTILQVAYPGSRKVRFSYRDESGEQPAKPPCR